jgi:hypothetical protein
MRRSTLRRSQRNKTETEAAVMDPLHDELLQPTNIKQLVDMVNEEAEAGSAHARAEMGANTAQLAEEQRKLENLYRAIEEGTLDCPFWALASAR